MLLKRFRAACALSFTPYPHSHAQALPPFPQGMCTLVPPLSSPPMAHSGQPAPHERVLTGESTYNCSRTHRLTPYPLPCSSHSPRPHPPAPLTRSANRSPLSPPLARLVAASAFGLALTAALGGLLGSTSLGTVVSGVDRRLWLRDVCSGTFAAVLTTIQVARIVADRVRARTHVGL